MTGDGYQKILKTISFLPTLSDKSFRENTRRLRAILASWGRTQIVLGTSDDWEADKNLMETNPDLASVNLWIDSSDFALCKYTGMSKKGSDWSYKCNSPGLRFMVLESASRKIRKIWGGYSPKMHDGEFLTLKKYYLEKRLINAVVIGDEHFGKGNKIFERLKFRTPIRKPGAGRPPADISKQTPKKKLTQEQKQYNKDQKALRARVESPFAWIKNNFKAFSKAWQEDGENLTNAVIFASACFNNTLLRVDYNAIE
jgi:hypothetical protein